MLARFPGHRIEAARLDTLAAELGAEAAGFIDDVVLAWACGGGDQAALRAFEHDVLRPVVQQLTDRGFPGDVIDDSVQVSRIAMVLGDPTATPPREPLLLAYRGRGPLRAFVRTACTRRALTLTTRGKRSANVALAAFVDTPLPDAELAYMRTTYGPQLTVALTTAWTKLAPHDRFILGLALESSVGTDEIARICGVHRATAARRVASARAALLDLAREGLRAELGIGGATLDSILRLFTTSVQWDAPLPPEA